MSINMAKIVGSNSLPESYLGSYGIVVEYAYGDKWMIELKARVGGKGSLKHTVSEKDFEIVETNPNHICPDCKFGPKEVV